VGVGRRGIETRRHRVAFERFRNIDVSLRRPAGGHGTDLQPQVTAVHLFVLCRQGGPMRQRSARSDFLAAQERGRWRTPLPLDRQTNVPWVFVAGGALLITPFSASKKKLNYQEEALVSAMQEQLEQLRREGHLPPGPTVWVWPDGRTPAVIETANQQWLKQQQAHHVRFWQAVFPICAHHDHAPDDDRSDRPLHGAACHGCLFVAETSCESRNDLLDRSLVTDTLEEGGAGYF
jgi:hypothetical protein